MTQHLFMPGIEQTEAAAPAAARLPCFEQIFHEEATYVGRTLRYLGVHESDVEDACQEVFVVVHRRLATLCSAISVRAWVRQICVFVASNHRRAIRRRREEVVAEPPDVYGSASQQGDVERRQLQARLLSALDACTEEQRHVFVLYEIEQLTMHEIAEAVGCVLPTAYSRLYAARIKVQAVMKGIDR